jgi:hypothetical protein
MDTERRADNYPRTEQVTPMSQKGIDDSPVKQAAESIQTPRRTTDKP